MNCFLLYEIGFHSGANSCRYRLKLNSKISHFLFSTPEGKSPWNHNLIINEKDNMSEQNEIKQNWDSSDLNFYCQGKKIFFGGIWLAKSERNCDWNWKIMLGFMWVWSLQVSFLKTLICPYSTKNRSHLNRSSPKWFKFKLKKRQFTCESILVHLNKSDFICLSWILIKKTPFCRENMKICWKDTYLHFLIGLFRFLYFFYILNDSVTLEKIIFSFNLN